MLRVSGDPMVRPRPLDVILYARSSYYYGNVYILNTNLFWFLNLNILYIFIV